MTEKEILIIYDKAEKYANNRMKDMPEHFKAIFIRDALYCAYLEGAGIKTRKIYNIIDKDKNKATSILMLIDSVLKKNRFFPTVDAEIYGYKVKLTEYEVRAIQLIIHNSTIEEFHEYMDNIIIYSGPKNHKKMIFRKDGKFENNFERGFYDINSNLMIQILLNK